MIFLNLPIISNYYQNRYADDAIRSMQFNFEGNFFLGKCARHHQIILKHSQMVENFYHLFIMFKLLQTSFLICFIAFTVSRVKLIYIF